MIRILLIGICVVQLLSSSAHQDRPIELKPDGTLVGLPDKYSPAHFDKTNFVLTIANNRIDIPDCVKEYFKDFSDYEIYFASSWYHDTEHLPPYIHMDIVSKVNYQFYFNLNTLEIFDVWRPELVVEEDGGNRFYSNSQSLSPECNQAVLNAITKI